MAQKKEQKSAQTIHKCNVDDLEPHFGWSGKAERWTVTAGDPACGSPGVIEGHHVDVRHLLLEPRKLHS